MPSFAVVPLASGPHGMRQNHTLMVFALPSILGSNLGLTHRLHSTMLVPEAGPRLMRRGNPDPSCSAVSLSPATTLLTSKVDLPARIRMCGTSVTSGSIRACIQAS
ncbi:hypothetical protein C8F01DRAFT_1369370 [Mycena amicta]|nr:hypothetical protein C8F01DRAFT_1369370 [Mycena amicta]